MNQEDNVDIILEAIEVFLQHILYVRDVYPAHIFKKRRVYNTPVFISIFPPLNSYIYRVLRTARELMRSKELEIVELLIYRNEYQKLERYTCQITQLQQTTANTDTYLLEFEEQLRSSLYKIAERLKHFDKLPSDAKFKVLLHTTQSGFMRLTHNAHYQEFPWLQTTPNNEPEIRNEVSILPLTNVAAIGLKLHVDV